MGLSSTTSANPTITLTNTNLAIGCSNSVTVEPALLPGTIAADHLVCPATVPSLLGTLAAPGGGTGVYSYQWESSPDNLTWMPILRVCGVI